jgi:hypothetical protein
MRRPCNTIRQRRIVLLAGLRTTTCKKGTSEWRQVAAVGGAAAELLEDDRKSLPAEHREQFLDSAHDDALQ